MKCIGHWHELVHYLLEGTLNDVWAEVSIEGYSNRFPQPSHLAERAEV